MSTTRKKVVKSLHTKTGLKPDYVEAINECSFSESKLLEELINDSSKDNSFQAIKNKINKLSEKWDKGIIRTGSILFRNCIIRKLKSIQKTCGDDEFKREELQERIDYFRKDQFCETFEKVFPSGKYSSFFDELFGVTLPKEGSNWRYMLGNFGKACDVLFSEDPPEYCYLCGNELDDDKACEHILPLLNALCHLWMVKSKKKYEGLSKDSKKLIKKEYAWAHNCCNDKKKAKNILIEDEEGEYYVSEERLVDLLDMINDDSYCYEIDDIDEQKEKLIKKFKVIAKIINQNVREYGSDYYSLFMKYKVIAAISDKHFERIIMGDELLGGSPLSSIEKINPLDGLVNIIKSEYLTNVILNDIDEYVKETVELYGIKEKIVVEHKPLKISQSFMHKKFVRPLRHSMLHHGITRQAGGTKKNKTRKLV
jgi:hypothetical protein